MNFKQALAFVKLETYTDYRLFLKDLYAYGKQHNKPFSYLVFSDKLGLGSNNISRLIIKGTHRLGDKSTQNIITALGLSGPKRKYFQTMVDYTNAADIVKREEYFLELLESREKFAGTSMNSQQMAYYSNWLNIVIREMMHRPDFKADADWIKSKCLFPVRVDQIKKSMELLQEQGLAVYDKDLGKLIPAEDQVSTQRHTDSMAITRFHQVMIDRAKEAITRCPAAEREIQNVTLAISDKVAKKLMDKIDRFLDEALEEEAADKSNEKNVYQMNVQLFPFTRD